MTIKTVSGMVVFEITLIKKKHIKTENILLITNIQTYPFLKRLIGKIQNSTFKPC